MRLMTTVGLLAALALMSPTAVDAGAAPAQDEPATPQAAPETLEAALEQLATVRQERDDALTAGAQAIGELGEKLAAAESRAGEAEKALKKSEAALEKAKGKRGPDPAPVPDTFADAGPTFEVTVLKGSVRHAAGKTTAPGAFDAPESDRESLLDLRARGVVSFADAD